MKKSQKTDARCIELMLKYISHMEEAYNHYNISSKNDLEENVLCHLAITQLITNVYECSKKLREKALDEMPLFSSMKRSLRTARNIASHEYEEVDFKVLHDAVTQLLRKKVTSELEGVQNAFKNSDHGNE